MFEFGKHEADLPPSIAHSHKANLVRLLKMWFEVYIYRLIKDQLFWVAQLFYKSCILCTKESICFLYLRLFNVGHRRFRRTVIASMAFIALYYVIATILTIFECTPVKKSWDKPLPGTCLDLQAFFFANAAFNVITDVLVMALPIPVIAKLQIKRRQRLGLALIFFVGLFATATSIVRMTTIKTGGKNADVSWTTSGSTIWSSIEMDISIVCACLPILRVPLQAIFPHIFGRRTTGSSHTAAEDTPGVSEGKWSRITTSGIARSELDDKDVDGLEMGAVGGKGMVLGKPADSGGESGSEDERYMLGDDESTPRVWVAVAKGEARSRERSTEQNLDRQLGPGDGIPQGIIKTTDVRVDYEKS